MKKFINNIISKVVTVIIGIVLLIYTLIHVTYLHRGYNVINGFYNLPKNSMDLAVVGTSVTFSSFMPYEAWHDYGISSYNYCTNVQFENSIKYSIRDIEKTQSPIVILVDIFPFIYEHNAGNTEWTKAQRELYIKFNLDSRKYNFDRFNLIDEILRDRNESRSMQDYLYYYFDIVRYHSNEINLANFNNSQKNLNRGIEHFRHVDKGYLIDADKIIKNDNSLLKIGERDEFYLKELVDISKSSKSKIIFICPPIVFSDNKELHKKNYIIKYLTDNNCIALDLTNQINKLKMNYLTDYYNETHFDALGAEKITKYLCEYIKNNYDIPDRRKDINYRYINDDYDVWKPIKGGYVFLDLTSVAVDMKEGKIVTKNESDVESINRALSQISTRSNIKKETVKIEPR